MKKVIPVLLALTMSATVFAQEHKLSREEILAMTTDQLSELSLEELMEAVETLGVSSVDELFELIMNKNVSSASKAEENSFTSPLSSTVITRDELRTYGITSIEEAFKLIPGMIVAEKANGVYDVQTRGLTNIPDNNMLIYTENANILLMVDGRLCYNYVTGISFFASLPVAIEDVERIEVVRGATSALYGANAVTGIINIITEKPDHATTTAQGSFQMGNNSTIADFGVRSKASNSLAFGLTCNFQQRNRKNGNLPLFPTKNLYAVMDNSLFRDGMYLSSQQFGEALATGKLVSYAGKTEIPVADFTSAVKISGTSDNAYSFCHVSDENLDYSEQFADPDLARRTMGVNGYVSITPSEDVRIDVQGGFGYALWADVPLGNEDIAFRWRETQLGYANVDVNVFGLHFQTNYTGGPIDLCIGNRAFNQDKTHNFNVQAEYDINVGDFSILPSLSYTYAKYEDAKPKYFDYGEGPEELCGYWGYYSKGNYYAEVSNFAPSLRIDFKHEGLRIIGAIRSDKSTVPEMWNTSWQLAANYQINDNNFVRAVYGRSFRATSLVNAKSDYNWKLATGDTPQYMSFEGNEDCPIVHIDNIEVGYRWKPSPKVLIDAEAFYSISSDYGVFKSDHSNIILQGKKANTIFATLFNGLATGQLTPDQASASIMGALSTKCTIKYDEVPFKVHQYGIGLNIDWIISPKLIAKLNANIQRTTIDNYYQYSQAEMVAKQLMANVAAIQDEEKGLGALFNELVMGAATAAAMGKDPQQYISDCLGYAKVSAVQDYYNSLNDEQQKTYLQSLLNAYNGGEAVANVDRPLTMYYALKYGVLYDRNSDEYRLASSTAEPYVTEDGYQHKATPSVYGMFGIICKPTAQWNIGAYANFMGKREYTTIVGYEEVDPRFTLNLKVGYKPVDACEVFFNAHNLFNTEKREFIYTDKIGGSYTVGVNFSF